MKLFEIDPPAVVQEHRDERRWGSWKLTLSAKNLVSCSGPSPVNPGRSHPERPHDLEQLANIPRKASILRAPAAPHEEGDR